MTGIFLWATKHFNFYSKWPPPAEINNSHLFRKLENVNLKTLKDLKSKSPCSILDPLKFLGTDCRLSASNNPTKNRRSSGWVTVEDTFSYQ